MRFDHHYEVVYAGGRSPRRRSSPRRRFSRAAPPRSSTPAGRSTTGERLRALPGQDRPDRVLLVIITDGVENASTDYTRSRVFEMISTQRDDYRWSFLFMAANQDAIQEGGHIGIASHAAMNFDADGASYRVASLAMSRAVSDFRQTGEAEFCQSTPAAEVKKKRAH